MTLSEMQNDNISLDLLFLQRMSYKKAKLFRNMFILTQLVIISINLLEYNQIVYGKNYFITYGILFLVTVLLMWLTVQYTNIGVMTQDYFDRRLFGLLEYYDNKLSIEEILNRANLIKKKYKEKYKFQSTNDGNNGGLRDWYTLPNIDDRLLPLNCQLENNIWSFYLAQINFFLYLFIGTVALGVVISFFWNQPLSSLIIFILRYVTIIVPFIQSINRLLTLVKLRKELRTKIYNLKIRKNISKDKLNLILHEIQVQSFTLRKEKYLISEMVYNIFRKKRHEILSDYMRTRFEITD